MRKWDIEEKKCLHTFKGHTDGILCLQMLSDGNLLTGSKDGDVRHWDVNTNECIKIYPGDSWIYSMRCTKDDTFCVVAHDRELRLKIINLKTHDITRRFDNCKKSETSLLFSRDSHDRYIFHSTNDNNVYMKEWKTGKLVHEFDAGRLVSRYGLAVDEETTRLVIGCKKVMKVVSCVDGSLIKHLPTAHDEYIMGEEFIANDQYLITVGQDNMVKIWDATSWQTLASWGVEGSLFVCCVNHSQTRLFTGGTAKRINMYYLKDDKPDGDKRYVMPDY